MSSALYHGKRCALALARPHLTPQEYLYHAVRIEAFEEVTSMASAMGGLSGTRTAEELHEYISKCLEKAFARAKSQNNSLEGRYASLSGSRSKYYVEYNMRTSE